MAFQIGDIKLSGTFDDISFYNSVFGWLARRKAGPSRKQFKTSPSFARARENSSEFTLCSRTASSFRRIIILYTGIKNKKHYHKLMILMRQLAKEDLASSRGERDPAKGLLTIQGQAHIKEFEITPGLSLYEVLLNTNYLKEVVNKKPQDSSRIKTKPVSKSLKRKRERKFRNRASSSIKQNLFFVKKYRILSTPKIQMFVNTAYG